MKIPEDWASLPLSSSGEIKLSCESLSKVDLSCALQFHARETRSGDDDNHPRAGETEIHSEGTVQVDDNYPRAGETELHSGGTIQVAPRGFLVGGNLFRCCPAKALSSVSSGREYKPGIADSAGKARAHTAPIPYSAGASHTGALPYRGPIRHSGTIITHPSFPKNVTKGVSWTSIIPADVVGKKKPPGYDTEEPTSPEVTCLGQVRVKQKQYKQIKKSADKKQNKGKKKKAPSSPLEKRRQLASKQSWGARGSMERKRASGKKEFAIDLGRFRSDYEAVPSKEVYSRGERGALLATTYINILAEIGSGGERIDTEYVPQVPPRNSLLLTRGSRNLEHRSGKPGFEELDEVPVPVTPKKENLRRQVSLPKPPPEASIWKRRAIAQPSALDIWKPNKLQIKQPTTR